MSAKMTLGGDVDFDVIAKKTPGFVGADLSSLTKEAAVVAINRIFTRLRTSSTSPTTPTTAGTSGTASGTCSSSSGNVGGGLAVGDAAAVAGTAAAADGDGASLDLAESGGDSRWRRPVNVPVSSVVGDTAVEDMEMSSPITSRGVPAAAPTAMGVDGASTRDAVSDGVDEEQAHTPVKSSSLVREDGHGGPDAVRGFLAGPLSPAQLAPLSVTMDDFLAAVKKVDACVMRN